MKRFYTIFLILIFSALGLAYFLKAGWHPLALINSQLVWTWSFEKEYNSALKYYDQAITTYNIPGMDEQKLDELKEDLKKATLNKIIEKIIISNGLKTLVDKDNDTLITKKIDKYLENSKLEAAATALFNLSFEEFKNLVLIPQAEKEIIEEKLETESRDFNNWLKNQKQQASVYLFTNEFIWTGEGIERRD